MRKWLPAGLIIFSTMLLPQFAFAAPENLMDVFHDALANDPTFKAAQSQYLANQENLPIARSALLPNVILSGTSERGYVVQKLAPFFRSFLQAPPTNFYNTSNLYSLNITQPLFNYSAWYALRGASFQVKQAEATFAASAQDLMQRTAQAYFKVMQANDTLRYTLAQKKAIAEQLRQAQQQFEVGLIAITGVKEAQANYDEVLANEIAARNNLAVAMEELRAITSRTYPQLMAASKNLPLVKPNPDNIERWVYIAECQNYSLRAAIENTNFAQQNIEVRRGGHFPVVSAVGSYTYDNESNGAVIGFTTQETTAAGVSVNFPIYQGGLVSAQTQQADYLYQQAISNMELTHRTVITQARDAYLGVITGINKITADRQAIISAQVALQATRAGYEAGTRTMLDVLNNLSSLYQALITYSADQYSYLTDILILKQAAGTLSPSDLAEMNTWLRTPVDIGSKIANLDKYSINNFLSDGKIKAHTVSSSKKTNIPLTVIPSIKRKDHEVTSAAHLQTTKDKTSKTALSLNKQEQEKIKEIKKQTAPQEKVKTTKDSYAIELFDTRYEQHANNFIRDHHLKTKMSYLKTKNAKGEIRYQVIYGKYSSLHDAEAALKKLPAELKKLNPWVKVLKNPSSHDLKQPKLP